MRRLLLLSGPLAVGKSSIANELIRLHNFHAISSGRYLQGVARQGGIGTSRADLQYVGDLLDEQTDYRWLIDDVAEAAFAGEIRADSWLLDSVRKQRQIAHFRAQYPACILHVHLYAPELVLRARYAARVDAGAEYAGVTSYDDAVMHPNEIASRALIDFADLVVDLTTTAPAEAAEEILRHATERDF